MKRLILSIIAITSSLSTIATYADTASDMATYRKTSVLLMKQDRVLFAANKDQFQELKTKMESSFWVSCQGNITFVCKQWWLWNANTYGCGIERPKTSYWKEETSTCVLTPKTSTLKGLILTIKTAAFFSEYPKDLDISDKFPYKRLQTKELSCESSATSDIVSAIKWINVNEDDIIWKLPKSDFYGKIGWWVGKNRLWWDPDQWFVWYIDKYKGHGALQYAFEWYGVYEKPIQKVYAAYWIQSETVNMYDWNNLWLDANKHLKKILTSLTEWSYVQLWWDTCTYKGFDDWQLKNVNQALVDKWYNWVNNCLYPYSSRIVSWYAYGTDWMLKKVNWLNWEHAFYLLWYKGGVENPTHVIVWDTHTGKHTYKTEEWMRKWAKMEYRSVITKK